MILVMFLVKSNAIFLMEKQRGKFGAKLLFCIRVCSGAAKFSGEPRLVPRAVRDLMRGGRVEIIVRFEALARHKMYFVL